MLKISVVILHFNHWDLTVNLLNDLYKHELNSVDELALVNNGSEDADVKGGQRFWGDLFERAGKEVKTLNILENCGFPGGANVGLKLATGDVKILLSNDIRVYGKFIPNLMELLDENNLVGNRYLAQDTGWNKFGNTIFPYLEGYLLAAHSKVWEQLGYFDERYSPADYEDIDLSTQARKLGIALASMNNPAIVHLGGQTLNSPTRMEQTEKNRKKFEAKWL